MDLLKRYFKCSFRNLIMTIFYLISGLSIYFNIEFLSSNVLEYISWIAIVGCISMIIYFLKDIVNTNRAFYKLYKIRKKTDEIEKDYILQGECTKNV